MSHRRGRVQIVSPEDELDNLQQLSNIQPLTTTPNSSTPFDHSTNGSSTKKRTRGPTRNLDLLGMKSRKKKSTQFNTRGQIVYDGKGGLSCYMETLVRNQHNVRIQVQDWNHVNEDVKEKIWALVLEKYELDETCKSYILQCCGNLFSSYRNKMKVKYYNPYNTNEERLCHRPPHLSDDEWRWLINFWGTPDAKDQFEQLLSQPDGISSFSTTTTTTTTSASSVASTSVDEIYTEVMGPERHGCVRGYGFGPTPASVFGPSSRRQSSATPATQLKNIVKELSNVKEELLHVKETFEERLIEFQRKIREEVKEVFDEKMMEMQRVQAQLQEQMMQMMQQFQQRQ